MSNYRRLISYIYAYEGGVKGKNIGFVKIEVRGGQCRIHVNVKKIYVGSNDIGVYLLAPKAEILLGRIFIRGGAGEFRMNVDSGNIEGSGCSMEECYGLTIHDVESTWQCYTTIWDDAVTQAAEMTLEDVTAEQVRRKEDEEAGEEPKKQEDQEKQDRVQFPITEEITRELEAEERRAEEEMTEEKGEVPQEDISQTDLSQEPQQAQEIDPPQQDAVLPDEQLIPEEQTVPEAEPAVGCPGPEDPAKLQELDRLEKEEQNQNRLWNQLQRRYAKVLAFNYDKGCEILAIKPQDIGLLPREIWVYGNNSFLLHGYYNYRHLILAKLNNPEGSPRYLLGVPGHYFSNEKYMASMFGFPHFVLARKQPEEDGRFGYWYTDIRL